MGVGVVLAAAAFFDFLPMLIVLSGLTTVRVRAGMVMGSTDNVEVM